jgi:hypothetical protein
MLRIRSDGIIRINFCVSYYGLTVNKVLSSWAARCRLRTGEVVARNKKPADRDFLVVFKRLLVNWNIFLTIIIGQRTEIEKIQPNCQVL